MEKYHFRRATIPPWAQDVHKTFRRRTGHLLKVLKVRLLCVLCPEGEGSIRSKLASCLHNQYCRNTQCAVNLNTVIIEETRQSPKNIFNENNKGNLSNMEVITTWTKNE